MDSFRSLGCIPPSEENVLWLVGFGVFTVGFEENLGSEEAVVRESGVGSSLSGRGSDNVGIVCTVPVR